MKTTDNAIGGIPQEPMDKDERKIYVSLAALVVLGMTAIIYGYEPIAILTGLGGVFAGWAIPNKV